MRLKRSTRDPGCLSIPKYLPNTCSSRNYTFGASLNYHINSGDTSSIASDAGESVFFRGYRFNIFQQTEFDVRDKGIDRGSIDSISMQLDNLVDDHVYIPVQISAAYNGLLGYGELFAGMGVQNKYSKDSRFQLFGQLLVGTNSHGLVLKPGIGLNLGLSDQL